MNSLSQAFSNNNLSITATSNYYTVENSQNRTNEQIQKIVQSAKFCPLIADQRLNGNIVFTVVPRSTASFSYFGVQELLQHTTFVPKNNEAPPKDPWTDVNCFRKLVDIAVNQGVSEILSAHAKENMPIVEIGSGIGYTITNPQLIRTQPSTAECNLLQRTTSSPIYHVCIEGLHNLLLGKKVSLFFALNVFDTMSSVERKLNLSRLSELQNSGDKILVVLDTNPYLNSIVEHIENAHPDHKAFPLCDTKFSIVLVPKALVDSAKCFTDPFHHQKQLQELKKKHALDTIALQDYFVPLIKNEFTELGYSTDIHYHAAFVTGDAPKDSNVCEDVILKSVTEVTLRQWSLSDPKFHQILAEKGLKMPGHFTSEELQRNGQRIFGAEFLVIAATKN